MWEVLAPIVRWPLYSPARFIGVVVGVLVVVFVVGEINGDGTPAAPDVAASASASPVAPSASTTPTRSPTAMPTAGVGETAVGTDELAANPADDDPSAAAVDAAAAFVAAWARPDLNADAWAAGVRPLVTADLWSDGLSNTDPASTPDVAVRGEPRQVTVSAEEAVIDVPTTGAWVRVHLAATAAGGWLVSRVEPAS